jgi:Tol biopolymer transport system component
VLGKVGISVIKGLIFTFCGKNTRTIAKTTIPITTVAALLIITIMLTGTTTFVNVSAGTFPGPNGQIAFSSDREDDNYEIYTMQNDGSNVTRLTDDDANDFDPSWSPDGEKIAFASFRDDSDNEEIYVMNANDSSNVTRLTDDDALDREPSWSPDGENIAFSSNRDGNWEIYVMNANDSSNVTRLTDDDALDREPSWSPDGEKIAFVSDRDSIDDSENEAIDNNEIYSMNADDGSDVTRLTDDDAFYTHPGWSPDGEKIAFVSNRDGSGNEIYSMNADDGSDVTRLTDDDANPLYPSWSPDGEKIAFSSNRVSDENYEVYVMNADDGSDVTRLTDDDGDDREPDWGTNTSPPVNGDANDDN